MKRLLMMALIFSTSHALADLSGDWNGSGAALDTKGWTSPCDTMHFQFSQTTTSFELLDGGYHCGSVRARFKQLSYQVVGQQLILNGKVVGKIGADFLHASSPAGPVFQQVFDLHLNGAVLVYEERWVDRQGEPQVFFDGQLSK